MRQYINRETNETTTNASTALKWHKSGASVGVHNFDKIHPRYTIISGAKQPPKRDENREHCKSISDELDKYVDGIIYTCPDCGEVIEMPETVGDKFKCPCCGLVEEVGEYNQLSLYDYFVDLLDIDYLVNYQKEYKGARILIAYGGPNIYLDTISGNVELYWWTETAKYRMRSDTIEALDEWAEEYYNCL